MAVVVDEAAVEEAEAAWEVADEVVVVAAAADEEAVDANFTIVMYQSCF